MPKHTSEKYHILQIKEFSNSVTAIISTHKENQGSILNHQDQKRVDV